MKKLNRKSSEGFTIIEVMIVLAIAGLIMLIVFLAVPALQRNSRNTQRKSDASHLMGLVSEYMSNHNGQVPTGFSYNATPPAGTVGLANENFSAFSFSAASLPSITTVDATHSYNAPTAALDTGYVYYGVNCNNNSPAAGGGSRSAAVLFYVEPGTTLQCVGN